MSSCFKTTRHAPHYLFAHETQTGIAPGSILNSSKLLLQHLDCFQLSSQSHVRINERETGWADLADNYLTLVSLWMWMLLSSVSVYVCYRHCMKCVSPPLLRIRRWSISTNRPRTGEGDWLICWEMTLLTSTCTAPLGLGFHSFALETKTFFKSPNMGLFTYCSY